MKHKYPVVGVKKAPLKSLGPFWGGALAVMVLALVGAGPGSFNQAIVQAFGGPLNLRAATAGQVPVKQADGSWAPGAGGGGGTDLTGLGTDNALARWDGTDTLQGSDATMTDAELLDLTATGALALGTTSGDVKLAKSATNVLNLQKGDGTTGGVLLLGSGTAAAPSLALNLASTGFYASTTNRLTVSCGASAVGEWTTTGYTSKSNAKIRWADSTSFPTNHDTALSRSAAGTVLVEDGAGTGSRLHVGAGSASNVALGLNADANTGLYGTADTSIGMAIGGTQIAAVGTTGITARLYPEAVTGNYTLANAQSMQVLTNTGAGGAVEIELGSITATGFAITVVATDNQDITLDPGGSDKFVGLAGGWADGEAMILDDQNDAVRLVRLSTGDWLVEWTRGTLTEETP